MNMPLNTLADASDPIEQARYNMIEQQIRPWNVLDTQVLKALARVHREDYVPAAYRDMAFADLELPLHESPLEALRLGQIMLAPRVEARMLQDLQLKPTDRVLEIGTGTGHMAALLASLSAQVLSLEIIPELVELARRNLSSAGVRNAVVRQGDGAQPIGDGPFDVIVLSGSVAQLPHILLDQLADGGRFGAIVGHKPMMRATFVQRTAQGFEHRELWDVVTARLRSFPEPSPFKF